jgi:hypothetical protein
MGFMRHQQKEYRIKRERTTFGSAFSIFHLAEVSLTGCSPAEPVYVSLNNANLIMTQFIEQTRLAAI